MSKLNTTKIRLNYRGGVNQQDRMKADKLASLRKALLYSYQAATAVTKDGEFRCLINPNKLTMEADDKELSIPFADIPLNDNPIPDPDPEPTPDPKPEPDEINSKLGSFKLGESYLEEEIITSNNVILGEAVLGRDILQEKIKLFSSVKEKKALYNKARVPKDIHLSVGDVIEWKENGTHWILYQRYLQEIAYYRFGMRQCNTQVEFENGAKYWAYAKGPDEKGIDWSKNKHFIFNNLNYSLEIYISKTQETNELFQRFKKVKVFERNWEVQAKDDITTEGLIVAYLKEDYSNQWAQVADIKTETQIQEVEIEDEKIQIVGSKDVYPYDVVEYKILNTSGGRWLLSNNRAKIVKSDSSTATVEITTGRSGQVSLIYKVDGLEDVIFNINILSL